MNVKSEEQIACLSVVMPAYNEEAALGKIA